MEKLTSDELAEVLKVVSSTIDNCEKMQPKFACGTSQYTLLKNRIKALYIAKLLLTTQNVIDKYTKDDLINSLPPISSIISKCEKAQLKFAVGTPNNIRLQKIIKTMYIAKALISNEIDKMA